MKQILLPIKESEILDLARVLENPNSFLLFVRKREKFIGVIFKCDYDNWIYCASCDLDDIEIEESTLTEVMARVLKQEPLAIFYAEERVVVIEHDLFS